MSTTSKSQNHRSLPDDIKTRREEEILEAAAIYFAECGYSEADTQTLADRLGVGKGTIYRYFPSKRELFLAAVDRLMLQLDDTISMPSTKSQIRSMAYCKP